MSLAAEADPCRRKAAASNSRASGWSGATLRISRVCASASVGSAASNRAACAKAVARVPTGSVAAVVKQCSDHGSNSRAIR